MKQMIRFRLTTESDSWSRLIDKGFDNITVQLGSNDDFIQASDCIHVYCIGFGSLKVKNWSKINIYKNINLRMVWNQHETLQNSSDASQKIAISQVTILTNIKISDAFS